MHDDIRRRVKVIKRGVSDRLFRRSVRRSTSGAGRLHALGKFVGVGKHRRAADAAMEGGAIRALVLALNQDAIETPMAAHRTFEARVVAALFLTDGHGASLANDRSTRQAFLRPFTLAR